MMLNRYEGCNARKRIGESNARCWQYERITNAKKKRIGEVMNDADSMRDMQCEKNNYCGVVMMNK